MIRHLLKLVWYRKGANALVMIEILLSFLVLFAVATFGISAIARWNDPLGYEWQDVWVLRIDVHDVDPNNDEAGLKAAVDRMLREARSFPQVVAAAAGTTPPYAMSTNEGEWRIDGKRIFITRDEVTDDYAKTMQMRILRGRWFEPSDDALGYKPVVIDTDLAATLYGDANPIGKKFDGDGTTEWRVIGVIPPYRKDGEFSKIKMNMMFDRLSLVSPKGRAPRDLVVRVRPGTSSDFEETLASRLHQVVPELSFRLRRMDRMRETSNRMRITPLIVGAVVAVFLITMVALGLTGVLWQNVTRRTRELGLRRAVGASAPNVRGQILGEVALLSTMSVILGVVVVMQLPLLGLFRVVTPPTFTLGIAGALAVIYGITLLCGLYPSWLASRLEPAEALRYE